MKTSTAGIAFITRWEGRKLTAYKDSGGVWTIGVGHTDPEVKAGLTITPQQADELLAADLAEAESEVNATGVPLTQPQFDALVSFAFNVGNSAFRSSTLRKKLLAGDYASVPAQMNRWVYDNGKVVDGLVNRRKAEGDMWRFGSASVVNTHPPEQTSTIPTPPRPAPLPPQRQPAAPATPPAAQPSGLFAWLLALLNRLIKRA